MSALSLTPLDVAVLTAIYNTLPTLRAISVSKPATVIKRPMIAIANVFKTLKLLVAILLWRRSKGCGNALKAMLWILQASMSVSGHCCG